MNGRNGPEVPFTPASAGLLSLRRRRSAPSPSCLIFSYQVADQGLIEAIMSPQPAPIVVRDYSPTDRKWVTDTNVYHYMTEEGFDASFATAVSSTLGMLAVQHENETCRFHRRSKRLPRARGMRLFPGRWSEGWQASPVLPGSGVSRPGQGSSRTRGRETSIPSVYRPSTGMSRSLICLSQGRW